MKRVVPLALMVAVLLIPRPDAGAQEPRSIRQILTVAAEDSEGEQKPATTAKSDSTYVWEQELSQGYTRPTRPRGETQFAFYLGTSGTQSSDVRFRLNGGTDMTYHDVGWHPEAFDDPPYYGIRITHYFAANPRLGLMLDFTHNKMVANFDEPIAITGVRNGQPVNTRETVRQSMNTLEMTNGLNFLTANLVYRCFLFTSESRPRGLLQPYVGAGIGVAFPHVETEFIGGEATANYQWRGPAFQAMVGTHVVIAQHLSLFGEYKFNNVVMNANISGGTQRTVVNTHQFLIGPSFNW